MRHPAQEERFVLFSVCLAWRERPLRRCSTIAFPSDSVQRVDQCRSAVKQPLPEIRKPREIKGNKKKTTHEVCKNSFLCLEPVLAALHRSTPPPAALHRPFLAIACYILLYLVLLNPTPRAGSIPTRWVWVCPPPSSPRLLLYTWRPLSWG